MPRPTPHSFTRQLGLQATMWGLFVAALVGASQLSFLHSRDRGVQIGALGPAEQFGWIKVALPLGWDVKTDRSGNNLAAKEPPHDGIQRILVIAQEQLDGPVDPQYLVRQLKHDVSVTEIPFAGLHVKGQLAQLTVREEPDGPPIQEYFAVAVVPNNVVIRVILRGVPAFGPIDDENFQRIVNSLQPGTDLPPSQVLPHVTGPLDPVIFRRDTPREPAQRAGSSSTRSPPRGQIPG
jgi:hypothetical protein